MKNLKMIGTWVLWCLISPFWLESFKYRKHIKTPELNVIHEQFANLLAALGNLGSSARTFDDQVRNRLFMILTWITSDLTDFSLEESDTAHDIMWKLNASISDNFNIRWNTSNAYLYEYTVNGETWNTQRFPDGTIWGKEMSEENREIAYLVHILLNGREEV